MPKRRVAIVPDFSERHDRSVVEGVSRFVHETSRWSLYVPPDPVHRVSMLQHWRGDGIIANFDDPDVVDIVRRKRLPAVGFGGGAGCTGKNIHYLATDDAGIGRMGAQHLLERGFRHFAYCAMPLTQRNQPWSELRGKAFKAAVEEEGHKCHVFRPSDAVSGNWVRLLKALCGWLKELPLPVGILAAYDVRGLNVLEACREVGLEVPDSVAVLGVDNDEQVCELGIPPLSSIIQGGARLGYEAATLLDRLMNGKTAAPGEIRKIPPLGVKVRHSTDTLAIDDSNVVVALRYIRDHACDGIQVADVVRQTSVSRVTLENRFKRLVGRTMHGEIKRIQLNRVKHLLSTSDMPIHEIARRAGFEYAEYLSNLFHRTTGQTLGQYRKEARGKGD